MTTAALDRLLALLLVAQVTTGLLTLRAGVPATAPLFWLHGLLGGALLVASVEKVRRSLGPAVRRRRWGRLALGGLVTLLVAAALAGGFAWVASGRILALGPWTILTLHVWAGLAAVPIVLAHVLPHRWRLLRRPSRQRGTRLTRRAVLSMAAVGLLGAAAWGTANMLDRLGGGVRRFTGSRPLPDGGIPPPTTFYGEPAPDVDPATWRLRVRGNVARELNLSQGDLADLGSIDRAATLDCTSGWAMTTEWRGTPLRAVLEAAGARPEHFVNVRSVTGWMVPLEHAELDTALLATRVAGQPLPRGNGAPCRLVAPARRGLDWVKWVAEVEVA